MLMEQISNLRPLIAGQGKTNVKSSTAAETWLLNPGDIIKIKLIKEVRFLFTSKFGVA
jgi:hypothetical protein